jgi:hypothetical protein
MHDVPPNPKGIVRLAMRGLLLASLLMGTLLAEAKAAEYFVAPHGHDDHDGATRDKAFATVQRGVDALAPGDTLTLLPGEYFGPVRRAGLGSAQHDTTLRADIAGTVLLHGDRPAGDFQKVAGLQHVYSAPFDAPAPPQFVIESDTLSLLERMPNRRELEFAPGRFHYDADARRLYVSTTDYAPPQRHRYRVIVTPTHGIYLDNARRVTIQGLAVTGFSAAREMPSSERSLSGTWGIFLASASHCVIRDCDVYLNGQGIGVNSSHPDSGNNLVTHCTAWANGSNFGIGDRGGLTLIDPFRDVVRSCVAFRNKDCGINIRGGGSRDSTIPQGASVIQDALAWGNGLGDVKIKTGVQHAHRVVGATAVSPSNTLNPERCLFFHDSEAPRDTIILAQETRIDMQREFADPDNHDYRLQSTSRFRATGSDGKDRGPHPYEANVYYLRRQGDDAADGLSMSTAWRTLPRAAAALRPGDTLYLEPGVHDGDLTLAVRGTANAPIAILGRGLEPVTLAGSVLIADARDLRLERLRFAGPVHVTRSASVTFKQSSFAGDCVWQEATEGRVEHCAFAGSVSFQRCSGIDLRANRLDKGKPDVSDDSSVRYAGYNSYDGAALSMLGWPLGPYRRQRQEQALRLVSGPKVHSVSATTANIEWTTSLPAACSLSWGTAPAGDQTDTFEVDSWGTYSITGLKPGTTYHFQIRALATPAGLAGDVPAVPVELTGATVRFTTASADAAPRTYHVAPDGDDARTGLSRSDAWRTLQHAADQVNAGDNVLIAAGTYVESVRLRATGAPHAPITFGNAPGEKVVLSGGARTFNRAWSIAGKKHLRLDGMVFVDSNRENLQGWLLRLSGDVALYRSHDVQITRCLSDGRNGYSARFVVAWQVSDLRIANCVMINKMSGAMQFDECPNLRFEHSVVMRPLIQALILRNKHDQPATFSHVIFTDMLEKKAKFNIGLMAVDSYLPCPRMIECGFFIRSFSPQDRTIIAGGPGATRSAYGFEEIVAPLFGDPVFAGDPGLDGNPSDKSGFAPDRLVQLQLPIDFSWFFATNPSFVERGIGLQPQAFADFHYSQPARTAAP